MIYGIIYKIMNIINGKCYIGQTIQGIEKRWKQHIDNSKRRNYPFCSAIKKYGPKNFIVEILCHCDSQEELDTMERYYTDIYWAWIDEWGYTCKAGNGKGSTSDSTKEKISAATRGKKPSLDTIERIRKTKKETYIKEKHSCFGKIKSDETRKKISESRRGKTPSLETRKKLSAVHSKTWILLSPQDETITISNLKLFCKENNLGYDAMLHVFYGNQSSHKGWKVPLPQE